MENGKENKSILYWLYQQCKNYRSREKERSDKYDILTELTKYSADSPSGEAEEAAGEEHGQTSEPIHRETVKDVWQLSEDKRYLEPLLKMTAVLSARTEITETTVKALESRLFAMVRKNPHYPDFCKEAECFARELAVLAAEFIDKIQSDPKSREDAQTDQEGGSQEPLQETEHGQSDAAMKLRCSPDGMYALAFLFPAFGGGKPADAEAVAGALEKAGIIFGIEAETVAALISGSHNMQIVLIARGSAPVDGKDGQITEKYPRVEEITIQQDERGTADFKNLNSVQTVTENQVICEMVLPTKGEPGTDVRGHIVHQREGILPPVPAGKNTRLSEDGTRLAAAASGHLLFRNGCFEVTEVLMISGDVDYSVGNLDFPGDIVIGGEVRAGFTVKAAGTITIHGTVEGAALLSGKDVILKKGMNGSYEGEIHAAGQVRASFLENCKIYANGSIYSNSIISCKTYSGDSVYAEGSIAAIMGGSVTALYSVTARTIGNKNLKETVLTLGTAPWLIEEKGTLRKEQKEVSSTLEKLNKNLDYLHKNKASIPAAKLEVLAQLEEQQRMYHEKKDQLESRLKELDGYQMNFSKCRVKGNMIFPATRLIIGPYVYIFNSMALRCSAHVSGEEIVLGTI